MGRSPTHSDAVNGGSASVYPAVAELPNVRPAVKTRPIPARRSARGVRSQAEAVQRANQPHMLIE